MSNSTSLFFLLPLIGLMLPFILWPIEQLFPYPYVVEEIAKGIFILFVLVLPTRTTKILYAILLGVVFTLSENVLYLFNILSIGTVSFALHRFLLTLLLHTITSMVILFSAMRYKGLIIAGVIASGIIHYFFNQFVKLL